MKPTSKITFSSVLFAYIPAVLWAVLIYFFSSQQTLPSLETSIFDYIFKKSAHLFVYAVLYYLLLKAARHTLPSHSPKITWLPLLLVLLYAISDEIHQQFVPGRYGTIRDVGYDMLGAGIVFLRQYRYI